MMTEPSTITAEALAKREDQSTIDLIDVRTPVEFREVRAVSARNRSSGCSLIPHAVMKDRNGSADSAAVCHLQKRHACCQGTARSSSTQASRTSSTSKVGRRLGWALACRWCAARRSCRLSGR